MVGVEGEDSVHTAFFDAWRAESAFRLRGRAPFVEGGVGTGADIGTAGF